MDYKTDLEFFNIGPLEVIYKENSDNDLFELTYHFNYGKNQDPKIALAASLMNYVGAGKFKSRRLEKQNFTNSVQGIILAPPLTEKKPKSP